MERMRCTGFYSDRPLPVQLIGFPPPFISSKARNLVLRGSLGRFLPNGRNDKGSGRWCNKRKVQQPPLSFRARREILYSGAVLEDFSLTVEMTRGVAGGAINEKYSNPPLSFRARREILCHRGSPVRFLPDGRNDTRVNRSK